MFWVAIDGGKMVPSNREQPQADKGPPETQRQEYDFKTLCLMFDTLGAEAMKKVTPKKDPRDGKRHTPEDKAKKSGSARTSGSGSASKVKPPHAPAPGSTPYNDLIKAQEKKEKAEEKRAKAEQKEREKASTLSSSKPKPQRVSAAEKEKATRKEMDKKECDRIDQAGCEEDEERKKQSAENEAEYQQALTEQRARDKAKAKKAREASADATAGSGSSSSSTCYGELSNNEYLVGIRGKLKNVCTCSLFGDTLKYLEVCLQYSLNVCTYSLFGDTLSTVRLICNNSASRWSPRAGQKGDHCR
jgi:hypothetical protein